MQRWSSASDVRTWPPDWDLDLASSGACPASNDNWTGVLTFVSLSAAADVSGGGAAKAP
jgi:hypothetical protein